MNYGYDGANDGELIKKYKIEHGKIIITFLDETTYEIAPTKENEEMLLQLMLEQARRRNNNFNPTELNEQVKKIKLFTAVLFLLADASCISCIQVEPGAVETFFGVTALSLILAILFSREYQKVKSDELKELEKYSIYLDIKDDIESIDDPNLFNGVEGSNRNLTINTLDSYTVDDIKRIKGNIGRCKKFSSYKKNTEQSDEQ